MRDLDVVPAKGGEVGVGFWTRLDCSRLASPGPDDEQPLTDAVENFFTFALQEAWPVCQSDEPAPELGKRGQGTKNDFAPRSHGQNPMPPKPSEAPANPATKR